MPNILNVNQDEGSDYNNSPQVNYSLVNLSGNTHTR